MNITKKRKVGSKEQVLLHTPPILRSITYTLIGFTINTNVRKPLYPLSPPSLVFALPFKWNDQWSFGVKFYSLFLYYISWFRFKFSFSNFTFNHCIFSSYPCFSRLNHKIIVPIKQSDLRKKSGLYLRDRVLFFNFLMMQLRE